MIVTIHQPEFFPWLGFFHKMNMADVMVLLDTVQFEKNNFQNRNKINIQNNPFWLTLPVRKHTLDTGIKDIQINWDMDKLSKRHLNSIRQNYCKCDYFNNLFPSLQKLYDKNYQFLADFNTEFIITMAEKLGIKTKIIRASQLSLSGETKGGTEVTLEISKILEARTYISGSGGTNYMQLEKYANAGIEVYFQEYKHPIYSQKNSSGFVSHLSVIDLYFNHGPKSLEIIQESNISKHDIEYEKH